MNPQKDHKNIFSIFVSWGARYGVPKSVVWGFIVLAFTSVIGMTVAFVKTTDNTNKVVPAYQIQTTQIQKAVTNLTTGQIQIQKDVSNTIENQNKFQTEVIRALDNVNFSR